MCEFRWQCFFFGTDGGANARMTPILTFSSKILPNLCSHSLTSHSQRSTLSVVCATESARFGCNRYPHAYSLTPLVVAVVRGVQTTPCFECVVDPDLPTANSKDHSGHSGQSLCSPVYVDAMPTVRVSTSGAAFGTTATCNRVSIFVLSGSSVSSAPPCLHATELLPWLTCHGYCVVIGNVPRSGFTTCSRATTFGNEPLLFNSSRPSNHCLRVSTPPPVATSTRVNGALQV